MARTKNREADGKRSKLKMSYVMHEQPARGIFHLLKLKSLSLRLKQTSHQYSLVSHFTR